MRLIGERRARHATASSLLAVVHAGAMRRKGLKQHVKVL